MGSTIDTCPPLGHPPFKCSENRSPYEPVGNRITNSSEVFGSPGSQVQDRFRLEPVLGKKPGQPLPSYVILANLLHFPGPRFSHLYNERHNCTSRAMKMK